MYLLRRISARQLSSSIAYSGQLLFEDRNQENLEFLEEALRLHPDSAEIQLLYATTLLMFRPEDVASEVVKAVGLAPDDPTILVRAAHLMRGRGEPEIALFYTRRARELVGPDFILEGEILNLEGIYAAFDKEYDFAEERLRYAVELDPDFESYAEDLARFLAARGRLVEALGVVDRALPQVKTKIYLENLREKLVAAINSTKDS